jgi:hypothetical protein
MQGRGLGRFGEKETQIKGCGKQKKKENESLPWMFGV